MSVFPIVHSLPEETISEILSPALKVSDAAFCDASLVSPFSKYEEPTSNYLLVCKTWLRIATPLLYSTVVLRSKGQAKALSTVLVENPEFGQYIKKLRVEGGYGPPMHTILECSPNISDLFLCTRIFSSDNTSGLCSGLELINPTRLILWHADHQGLGNRTYLQLLDALVAAIPEWDNLRIFQPSFYMLNHPSDRIAEEIAKARKLTTVVVTQVSHVSWVYNLYKKCPLQQIQVKTSAPVEPDSRYRKQLHALMENPKIKALLRFNYPEQPTSTPVDSMQTTTDMELPSIDIVPSLNPFFKPLSNAALHIADKIWDRVLFFAFVDPHPGQNPVENFRRCPDLLLVSKTIHRLGIPHHYARVYLHCRSSVRQFRALLSKKPAIALHVRHLVVHDYTAYHSLRGPGDDPLSAILSRTSGLLQFGDVRTANTTHSASSDLRTIPWTAFEVLGKTAGPTLRECCARIWAVEDASAAVFNELKALRTLMWDCDTTFTGAEKVSGDGLLNLEELHIRSTDLSFIRVLSRMRLEFLRRIVLSTEVDCKLLFEVHGPKLTELVLQYKHLHAFRGKILTFCPNLQVITITEMGGPPGFDELNSKGAIRPALTKIVFDVPECQWRKTRSGLEDKNIIFAWDTFFKLFEPKKHLPNLQEIEFEDCVWPTNERDIEKSRWVRWAELLLKHDVHLADKNGTRWKRRAGAK
ncbi:F-box domain-containing protein [Favolaschia claudopus]|uniref:F-box domain-containing protein n=1 Tax=Favolaschia claudopus TaxID=2862362 RepID=A0AAW0C9D4_9AGAR